MKSKVYKINWQDYQKNHQLLSSALDQYKDFFHGSTAVKTHFGEPGNENALRGKIIKPITDWLLKNKINAFLTDTNTLYKGQRSNATDHLKVAQDHGFASLGLPIIIADGENGQEEKVFKLKGLKNQYKNLTIRLGKAIANTQNILCISHVKGHPMFGFGGALKNLGMGSASPAGKKILHSTTAGKINPQKCTLCETCIHHCPAEAIKNINGKIVMDYQKCIGCGECVAVCPQHAIEVREADAKICQEKTAVYVLGAIQNKPILCINLLININPICDCFSSTQPKLIDDLGILISQDPVAIDQASLDWINKEAGKDLFLDNNGVDYNPILAMGEKIGSGKRKYQLQKIVI